MKYSALVSVYEELSKTTKKLEKTAILARFLPSIEKHPEWIYLLRGRVVPEYDSREFGMSTQLVIKSIAKSSGMSAEEVSLLYKEKGDLGDIAETLVAKKTQSALFRKQLTVDKVFETLTKLLSIDGPGTVDKKVTLVVELLSSAGQNEARYIIRTVLNDLRVGVADALLRDAIAHAYFPGNDVIAVKLDRAYDLTTDFALLFGIAQKGEKELDAVGIVPGKPLKVMLPVKVLDIEEAFRICGNPLAVEHKYDGFRVVISKQNNQILLFTRKLENVTKQFPDVVAVVKTHITGDSFILDSEVVGYDPKDQKYLPFEAISQRIRRKYDIEEIIAKIPVEINVFDIVYHNGKSAAELPFKERRKLLESVIKQERWKIRPSTQFISGDAEDIQEFYEEALRHGEEGIMMKSLEAPYQPGRRVGHMVKMKPDATDLDLVIVGAEYGTGKRAGGLTSFVVACKSGDQFLEVGKVSTGLKEKAEMGTSYGEINDILQPLITKKTPEGVLVKPQVVVSVTYQNIQPSPHYNSGYALRFPRITHYRPERGVYDIATLKDIEREAKRGNN